jgi:hypothetical protein
VSPQERHDTPEGSSVSLLWIGPACLIGQPNHLKDPPWGDVVVSQLQSQVARQSVSLSVSLSVCQSVSHTTL